MCALVAGFAGVAHAQVVVNSDITVSTTWTASNVYDLQASVYVDPGATLTIEAGTRIASTAGLGGSLTICKGATIIAKGEQFKPIIFTSSNDNGTWRHVNSEWGCLVIMGAAYVSTNQHPGNIPTPDAANRLDMEGLIPAFPGDTRQQCGGGDDDDDTGTLAFVSLRYGGKVVSLGNELNGLSVGAIGRGTTLHHLDVCQNVDDGIETWGGTVNFKYINVWNIGDDSFDFDCGWRGKAQFGLLVQGYSADGSRGGGVGDNGFEMDGAEDSDWQPVSTNVIANFTLIGQPLSGHSGTAWRDDNRTQFHNCIFMDVGQEVVHNDVSDGDHCTPPPTGGYGMGGSLDFPTTWATSYTQTSLVNPPVNPPPSYFYKSQTSGNLAEITNSVFARNQYSPGGGIDAYTTANSVNVFAAANNNTLITSILDADMPVQTLTRGAPVSLHGGTLTVLPVTFLDPLPKNAALSSVGWQTEDGFFQSAHYAGAFAPSISWLRGWTSSEEWGLVATTPMVDLGRGLAGVNGDPVLSSTGTLAGSTTVTLDLNNAKPSASTFLVIGYTELDAAIFGGTLIPFPNLIIPIGSTNGSGSLSLSGTWPNGVPAHTHVYFQEFVVDPAGPFGWAISNGVVTDTP